MELDPLSEWLDIRSQGNALWYAKRLAANDTLATGAHQAGPYIPKEVLFKIFPTLNQPRVRNPDKWFCLSVDSHGDHRQVRAIWYNNKRFQGTRDETRVTNFGGRESPLLAPDSTGALAVFAFPLNPSGSEAQAHVWIARTPAEEDLIEERIGPVEPGRWILLSSSQESGLKQLGPVASAGNNCRLRAADIPPTWMTKFPTGAEIIRKAIQLRPDKSMKVDTRLVRRRDCEFEVFLSVEEAIELPKVRKGFRNLDEFITRAHTVLQRRKSRAGRSLELHLKEILVEEGFNEGTTFSHNPESEPGKRPDFLFPSAAAYKNSGFQDTKLRMLAVKTTCKDRWRQILNEADRIKVKHLLTLQEGVSESQYREMKTAGVRLVVPKNLHRSYPKNVRGGLLTLEAFLQELEK
jgi:hypothetical protein